MAEVANASASSRRLPRRLIRTTSVIIPHTGEKLSKQITLREPRSPRRSSSDFNMPADAGERTPLLGPSVTVSTQSRFQRASAALKEFVKQTYEFWKSTNGQAVFKCSLAYFIASLATFSDPIARILSTHHDGNQLVANIVVWFDPNRTEGAMEEGTILALLAWVYAVIIGFASMGTAVFFDNHGLIEVGHVIILIFFVGGGFGLIAWTKHWFNHPLVNVACSIVSAGLVTVLTREGAVQAGELSFYRILQLLKMLIMAIAISLTVNFLVFPLSARKKLRKSFIESTDALGDLLTTVTSSFLAGSEDDMRHPAVVAASDKFQAASGLIVSSLTDSRFEHYILGREKQWHLERKIVKCLQRLSEDMGGLKSAAEVQFSIILASRRSFQKQVIRNSAAPNGDTTNASSAGDSEAITSDPPIDPDYEAPIGSAERIFDTFISQLGPPMKSLAYTMKEILAGLPYAPERANSVNHIPKFRSSLIDAIKLFSQKQKEAIASVYKSRDIAEVTSQNAVENFEEVAASCGHFSSCLLDFAENCVTFLDILDHLDLEITKRPHGRTWYWIMFWQRQMTEYHELDYPGVKVTGLEESSMTTYMRRFASSTRAYLSTYTETPKRQPFPYSIWPYLRVFRRDDVKYATKVGGGAAFIAMFAYLPQTRPVYQEWHLDWALTAYMIVCSMTIGASNTNAWQRLAGTCLGAALAIPVWILCQGNPYALAASGWVIAVICFYFTIAKGLGPLFRFTLLTYNLSVLYSYGLSIGEPDMEIADEDNGGAGPEIYKVVKHRFIAISLGIIAGMLVTRMIWPLSARNKLKKGLALLWLRMSLIWKTAPLSTLIDPDSKPPAYLDIREETDLRNFMLTLQDIKGNADSEFHLRGPFAAKSFDALLQSTARMLDSFHALAVVMTKNNKATIGETQLLKYTTEEREQASTRLSHLLAVLASSLFIAYPITKTNPKMDDRRGKLLAKVFEFRKKNAMATHIKDEDFELLYAFSLVIAQIAQEIDTAGKEIEKLYDIVEEEVIVLQ